MNFAVKSILGFILSIGLLMLVMPVFIKSLKNRNVNQVTSEYALDEYKNKSKTPIMGGLLFARAPPIFMLQNTMPYSRFFGEIGFARKCGFS